MNNVQKLNMEGDVERSKLGDRENKWTHFERINLDSDPQAHENVSNWNQKATPLIHS